LATPVPIAANTAYVSSYVISGGPFAYTSSFFATQGVDDEPLHLSPDGAAGPNGPYHTGGAGFPTESWKSTNYWSDVLFTPTP
jgi:hypothetical protein